MQITYQKKNGCIIQKLRKTMLPYKIGDRTSMGWKVINIEFEYNNKFYSAYDYNMLIRKEIVRHRRKEKIKAFCINKSKSLLYFILGYIILNYIKIRIGI